MAGVAEEGRDIARELEDVREQQRAITGVLRAVARSAGLQPVLDEVAEACRRICKADYGAVWLLKEGLLHLGAHQGEAAGAEYDRAHPHALDRTSAAGRAAVERRPVQIPDVLADPEYTYPGPRFFRAMLGVPIMFEDGLVGVVVVVRREPEPFTHDHIALAQTFADQAAIALTNARVLEAVERQRTELSRSVSPQVTDLISSEEGERLLAGHRAYISSLFCDLRGFTAFAETAAPEELFDVLREYHAMLGELMPAFGGTLEQLRPAMECWSSSTTLCLSRSMSPSPSASGSQLRLDSRSCRKPGANAESSWGSESGSRPDTRPSVARGRRSGAWPRGGGAASALSRRSGARVARLRRRCRRRGRARTRRGRRGRARQPLRCGAGAGPIASG